MGAGHVGAGTTAPGTTAPEALGSAPTPPGAPAAPRALNPNGPNPTGPVQGNAAPGDPLAEHTPPQPHPAERPEWAARATAAPGALNPVTPQTQDPGPDPTQGRGSAGGRPARQPLPAETPPGGIPAAGGDTQGRAFSVRALGQGAPFSQTQAQVQAHAQAAQAALATQTSGGSLGSGRRRKLGTPPEGVERPTEPAARPHPVLPSPPSEGQGRAYAIGRPDEGAEGPEPLDGPGGAVEVANRPQPGPVDDELPPEPLDNPRRLLVWPAPDVSTQQALSERGYRPVVVHSREEVDAQIAAFPAALFVDPLTGPITRTDPF
ncbi:PAS domain S-box protein, partial [Streptomyces hundungensis]